MCGLINAIAWAEEQGAPVKGDPARGYQLLVNQPFLTHDFHQSEFDDVWRSWPTSLRETAEISTSDQRREIAFARYGLTVRPGDEASRKPLQYVVDSHERWTMNCFSCHGGSVYGVPTPGAPNNRFALQTMTEDIRATKFRIGNALSRMDLGSLVIPLGTTVGTTNAVVFGMALMQFRDDDLNVVDRIPVPFTHHDMDAPPWWYFYKRPYLYIDGFAPRGHRGLMQFMLIPENGPSFFRNHEDDFRDVYAYLMSLRPPKYTGPIDEALVVAGRPLFEQSCAQCHGTYGESASYPNRSVPMSEIGTDSVRFESLTSKGRQRYADSWFAQGDDSEGRTTIVDPIGYVAPPLDGVWASPPYLHNGSVPTLWHLLHPDERPTVWRRTAEAMDVDRVGFQIESVDRVPASVTDVGQRREYFDTRRFGKNNQGHDYPNVLNAEEKRAVLEYLKTL
jgi:cytochrome c553